MTRTSMVETRKTFKPTLGLYNLGSPASFLVSEHRKGYYYTLLRNIYLIYACKCMIYLVHICQLGSPTDPHVGNC